MKSLKIVRKKSHNAEKLEGGPISLARYCPVLVVMNNEVIAEFSILIGRSIDSGGELKFPALTVGGD